MKKEKVVHFRTKKIVSHDGKGMPEIEDNVIKVSPEFQATRYVNLINMQNFLSVDVVKVLQRDGEKSEFKEIDEIEKWQSMIDNKLKAPEKVKDYKKAYEDQNKDIENLKAQMAELLADKASNNPRLKLEAKANELEISFRSTIGDDKLLLKIQEIEPEFKL